MIFRLNRSMKTNKNSASNDIKIRISQTNAYHDNIVARKSTIRLPNLLFGSKSGL